MSKLFWQISTTLDGFMEGPNRELDRTAQVVDEDFERYCSTMLQSIEGFLIGRKTYELFVGHWPTATGVDADRLNALPKVVVSRTLSRVEWANGRLAGPDLADEVRHMKRHAVRDLAVFGSAHLASTLLRLGLIDEVRLLVTPFVLGRGSPTFPDRELRADLKLASSIAWRSGTVALTYTRA